MSEGSKRPREKLARSALAKAASQTNGTKSRGPRTEAGKRQSSLNSRKHGLRSSNAEILQVIPASLVALAQELRAASGGNTDALALVDRIVVAEFNRNRAADLLSETLRSVAAPVNEQLLALAKLPRHLFRANDLEIEFATLRFIKTAIEQDWVRCRRYSAYERRFRGQRDRTLREFTKLCEGKGPRREQA